MAFYPSLFFASPRYPAAPSPQFRGQTYGGGYHHSNQNLPQRVSKVFEEVGRFDLQLSPSFPLCKRIMFLRERGKPESIFAKVLAFERGIWVEENHFEGDALKVEIISRSSIDAKKNCEAMQKTHRYPHTHVERLSFQTLDEQDKKLRSLQQSGRYSLELKFDTKGSYLGKIVGALVYDPN